VLSVDSGCIDTRLRIDAALSVYVWRFVIVVVVLYDLALEARWGRRDIGMAFRRIRAEIGASCWRSEKQARDN